MKYILTFLSCDQPMKWYPESGFAATTDDPDLATATRFDTLEEAATAYEKTRAYYDGLLGLRIQGIEEIPGETRREVVELEGVVDLTGLKFALRGPVSGWFYGDTRLAITGHIEEAPLYDSIQRAAQMSRPGAYVVGIREVTTDPAFRIVPLD